MIMHTPYSVHPPLRTSKRSPEFARRCKHRRCCKRHTQPSLTRASGARALPIIPSASVLPTSNDNDACPMGHASTTGDTQAVPRTSQTPHKLRLTQNLNCHCIHTHVWHWGTTCPFRSLIMSRNDNACSKECATTTEDTQEVPRACQVPHKLHLPLHYFSCVVHTNFRAPNRLGGTTV